MSVYVVDAVLDSRLDCYRLLAVVLATYADSAGGSVYPAVETLARRSRTTPRAVQAGLRRLRELGVIVVESRVIVGRDGHPRPVGGRANPTRYHFQLDVLASLPESGGTAKWVKPASPFFSTSFAQTVKPTSPFTPSEGSEKGEASFAKGRSQLRERVKLASQKGEAGFTRSVRIRHDPSGSGYITGAHAPGRADETPTETPEPETPESSPSPAAAPADGNADGQAQLQQTIDNLRRRYGDKRP